jgi:uncharacterized protein YdhG (YjbR/CyaY superfamily)
MGSGVQEYINKVSDQRRELLLRLQKLILDLYPESEIKISYGVIEYKIATGKVWLGYWKQGVSLYTGAISKVAEIKEKHPGIKTGKGCLNFKLKDIIPLQDVNELIEYVMTHKNL